MLEESKLFTTFDPFLPPDPFLKHPNLLIQSAVQVKQQLIKPRWKAHTPSEMMEIMRERFQRFEKHTRIQAYIPEREFMLYIKHALVNNKSNGEAALDAINQILTFSFRINDGSPGEYLVEKTPRHLFYSGLIMKHIPMPVVVLMMRDGREVMTSLESLYQKGESWVSPNWDERLRNWKHAVRYTHHFLKQHLDNERVLFVKYEDLTADTPGTLHNLLEKFQLPRDSEQIATLIGDETRINTYGNEVANYDELIAFTEKHAAHELQLMGYELQR